MNNLIKICILIFSTSLVYAESISIMSINAQNLFDTIDDKGKDDKAFLPIELKQEALSFCKKLERRNFYSKYQYTNITQLIDVLNKEPTNKEALKRQINFFDNVTTKKYEDIDPKIVEWVNG